MNILNYITPELLSAVLTAVATVVVSLLGLLAESLRKKINNDHYAALLDMAETAATKAVMAVEQTFVKEYHESYGERLDPARKSEAFMKALRSAKGMLGEAALKEIDRLSKSGSSVVLSDMIEAAILKRKDAK